MYTSSAIWLYVNKSLHALQWGNRLNILTFLCTGSTIYCTVSSILCEYEWISVDSLSNISVSHSAFSSFTPACNPVYKIVFPCSFPGVFFSFTQKSRSVCRAVPPMQLRRRAQSAQKQTLFRLIFGSHLVYRPFSSRRTPPALAAAFWGRSDGSLFAESAVRPLFSACKCPPEALPPLDSPPELRPPPPCIQQGRFAG